MTDNFENLYIEVQKQLSRTSYENAKLHASISSLPFGIIITDSNNIIVSINEKAKTILSNSHIDQTPTFTLEAVEKALADKVDISATMKQSISDKKIVIVKEIELNKSFFKIVISPIFQEAIITGVVILFDDITEAKIIERSRDEFFSIASHELRTPLTAIRGNTALIKQYYPDALKDTGLAEMIDDIHESSLRLISIVNDFLDTSRLELGKIQFKKDPIDMSELVESVMKEYTSSGSMKDLYLYAEKPKNILPVVVGDRDRIKQILINLIGNAIKFTTKGGITISFLIESPYLKVLVTDTGKGVPLQNQNLLFRKFQQANDNLFTRDAVQGTGLGLYISKMMIEGMGGKIKLESSEENKGTTFSISIPIQSEALPQSPTLGNVPG